jgi:hypothetical protein
MLFLRCARGGGIADAAGGSAQCVTESFHRLGAPRYYCCGIRSPAARALWRRVPRTAKEAAADEPARNGQR